VSIVATKEQRAAAKARQDGVEYGFLIGYERAKEELAGVDPEHSAYVRELREQLHELRIASHKLCAILWQHHVLEKHLSEALIATNIIRGKVHKLEDLQGFIERGQAPEGWEDVE